MILRFGRTLSVLAFGTLHHFLAFNMYHFVVYHLWIPSDERHFVKNSHINIAFT